MTELHESFKEVMEANDDFLRKLQDFKECRGDCGNEMLMGIIIMHLFFCHMRLCDAMQQWADCGFPVKETDTGIFELVKEE